MLDVFFGAEAVGGGFTEADGGGVGGDSGRGRSVERGGGLDPSCVDSLERGGDFGEGENDGSKISWTGKVDPVELRFCGDGEHSGTSMLPSRNLVVSMGSEERVGSDMVVGSRASGGGGGGKSFCLSQSVTPLGCSGEGVSEG